MIQTFENEGLIVAGHNEENEPKLMEYSRNDFFIITLFLPQLKSGLQEPHPLISGFLEAALVKQSEVIANRADIPQ